MACGWVRREVRPCGRGVRGRQPVLGWTDCGAVGRLPGSESRAGSGSGERGLTFRWEGVTTVSGVALGRKTRWLEQRSSGLRGWEPGRRQGGPGVYSEGERTPLLLRLGVWGPRRQPPSVAGREGLSKRRCRGLCHLGSQVRPLRHSLSSGAPDPAPLHGRCAPGTAGSADGTVVPPGFCLSRPDFQSLEDRVTTAPCLGGAFPEASVLVQFYHCAL